MKCLAFEAVAMLDWKGETKVPFFLILHVWHLKRKTKIPFFLILHVWHLKQLQCWTERMRQKFHSSSLFMFPDVLLQRVNLTAGPGDWNFLSLSWNCYQAICAVYGLVWEFCWRFAFSVTFFPSARCNLSVSLFIHMSNTRYFCNALRMFMKPAGHFMWGKKM